MSFYSHPSVCDFSGLWNPSDLVVSAPSVSSSEQEMKTWPRLALGVLKLDPKTLRTVENCEVLNIRHTESILTVQHLPSLAAAKNPEMQAAAPALTLNLDNKPHTFNTGVGPLDAIKINSADLTITACQLDESECNDLLIKLEFPPRDKKGNLVKKFSNFGDEQLALHRAGYILERTHKSTPRAMTQLIQYHRAPAKMKDSAVKEMDAAALPIVYAITRTYRLVEKKEDVEDDDEPVKKSHSSNSSSNDSSSSSSSRSRNGSPGRINTTTSSKSISSTPPRSVIDSLIPASPGACSDAVPQLPFLSLAQASERAGPTAAGTVNGTPAGSSAAATPSASAPSSSLPALAPSSLPPPSFPPVPPAPLPYCTLSGTWKVDKSRSDSLEEMMKVLGVPWIARKVVMKLDVTTRIAHDPKEHKCTVTDSSSAGEQATEHETMGNWKEVVTKEGKKIKMCAKEGEEMRQIWTDLPPLPSDTIAPFPPSSTPFTFPSYFPLPLSPSHKLHPFTYGYLWIHSFLSDIEGGEMQDIRMLVDRTSMVQCTQVLKDKKVLSTTTRYFNKQETEEERRQGEKEWEEKMEQWKRVHSSVAAGVEARENEEDGPKMPSETSSASAGVTASPSPSNANASASMPSALSPNPNLSGTWAIVKDRSNDLSILLKRMGIPWIYRAFASTVEIKTQITHTPSELILKDTSKFGSHTQSLKVDGTWSPVTQYGKARSGYSKVTSDPEKQSITIETVYLTTVKGKARQSPTNQISSNGNAAKQASASSFSSSSAKSATVQPRPSSSFSSSSVASREKEGEKGEDDSAPLLTAEASNSPGPKPVYLNDSLVREEDETSLTLGAPAIPPAVATTPGQEESKEGLSSVAAMESTEGKEQQRVDYSPGHSPLPGEPPVDRIDLSAPSAAKALEFDLSELGEEGSAPSSPVPSASQVPGAATASSSASVSVSGASSANVTPLVSPLTSSSPGLPPLNPLVRSSSGSVVMSSASARQSPKLSPSSAPLHSNQIVSSRIIDIRVLQGPDTMRQVITYLEFGTVVCVCSRVFRRELSKQEAKTKQKADQEVREAEKRRLASEEEAKEAQRKRREALAAVLPGPSPAVSLPQPARHASPSTAAPVSVVVPSLVAEPAPGPSQQPQLTLSALTPARAILLFLFLSALASGSPTLIVIVLGAITAYCYQQYTSSYSAPKAPVAFARSSSNQNRASQLVHRPSIQLGPGLSVEVVPLRRDAQ